LEYNEKMEHITVRDIKVNRETVIALGKFEALHIGHTYLIDAMMSYRSRGLSALVFSFNPSPSEFFSGGDYKYLFTSSERARLIKDTGADYFVEYPFDEAFSRTSPERFIEFMRGRLNCRRIVVGESFRFGYQKSGGKAVLQAAAGRFGFGTTIVPRVVDYGGETVSSSRVRGAVLAGDMPTARRLLGRAFFIDGAVQTGKGLARTIGFPTVNLKVPKEKLTPPDGVYAATVEVGRERFPGIANVGTNPTFDERERKCETHILNFSGDLYGREITVRLERFIRSERRFSGVEELKERITEDITEAYGEKWRKS
jgi:riboflavin kinase/FMN adenylyltransferase